MRSLVQTLSVVSCLLSVVKEKESSWPISRVLYYGVTIASVIYLCLLLPAGYSGLPSGSGEQPSNTGIHDLATPGTHSSGCHHPDWWALTPPSHPYLANEAVIFFYVNPAVTDTLHINKRDALRCPDFPHTPRGSKRQTVQLLPTDKDSASREKCQISKSESREKACVFFTKGGRDTILLNLFEHFRAAAYIQAAKLIKYNARARENVNLFS